MCSKRYFAHVLFSLCTRRHEKGLMPYSCQSLARDSTRQFPFICTGFFRVRVYIVYFAIADVFYRKKTILFLNKVGRLTHMRFHCEISRNIGANMHRFCILMLFTKYMKLMYIKNIWSAWLIFYIAITSIHFITVVIRAN